MATSSLSAPSTMSAPVAISGVMAGETLVSIDVRPQTQRLYGLGVNATADTVQLYHISPQTAVAVPVGAAFSLTTDGTTLVDFPATGWDIDFNPAVDRLRIVTQSGLNFRINPNNGTPVDGNNGQADVMGINPDGGISGPTTSVSATAYTNSQPNNGNITTQYTVDATTNSLYIQNPPNNGTQALVMPITVAGQTLEITAVSGFDIPPLVNAAASNAPVASGVGYAVLRTSTSSKLYQINLVNGQAVAVANFAPLSFAINPGLSASIGLNAAATSLVRFSPLNPGTITTVGLGVLNAGETLVGIDLRPATGQFYGLGINPNTETGTLYLVDPQLGSVTIVGVAGAIQYVDDLGAPVNFPLPSEGWDIDFNPLVDRLRVVTGTGLNLRIDQRTGIPVDGNAGIAGTQPDGAINGATTSVHGTAYTNSFSGTAATTQYTLDAVTNSLYIQSPPNNGTQTTPVPVTLAGAPLNFDHPLGFDILGSVAVTTNNSPATGDGFFAATVDGNSGIYRVNLTTGAATLLGAAPTSLSNFAVFSVAASPTVIAPVVVNLAPTSATLGATVSFDGGSPITERGIVFATTATQPTPVIGGAGVTQVVSLSSTAAFTATATGLTTGTSYSFRAYAINASGVTYSAALTFTPPILEAPIFPALVVSESLNFTLNAQAGTTFTAVGLPPGLVLNTRTGVITGRPTVSGVFKVVVTAKRTGSPTVSYISSLAVKALPRSAVGTYLAYIMPDSTIDGDPGGRIDLTTTLKGTYTLKITQKLKTTSVTGVLNTSSSAVPSLSSTLADGTQIVLDLKADDTLSGTVFMDLNQATVTGWRKIYDRLVYPASDEMGYYSVSLNVGMFNIGNDSVPQGTGFAGITIGEDGVTKFTGMAADGSLLTSTGFMGPDGEILVYVPLYAKLGSISGILTQSLDPTGGYSENSITGSLALSKPQTTGRTYTAEINQVELVVEGKYLARAAAGSIVLGLPSSSDPSTLDFSLGGLDAASINPDLVDAVTFLRPTLKTVIPAAGSAMNPGRTTLLINTATGSVTGNFYLVDGTLRRTVKYQGMIVRTADGSTTANGYFLLPQIAGPGQTNANSPILSGRVDLVP